MTTKNILKTIVVFSAAVAANLWISHQYHLDPLTAFVNGFVWGWAGGGVLTLWTD